MVFNISLLFSFQGYSQEAIQKEEFDLNGVQVLLYKYPMVKTDEELCEVPSVIKLIKEGKQVYYERICAVELADVEILAEGYLTIIRHYSSPVGWSKAYIIDLYKRRVIETKELDEGTEIKWTDFIDLSKVNRDRYVKNITNF